MARAAVPTSSAWTPPAGTHTSPRTRRVFAALSRARELCPITLRGLLVLLAATLALYVYGVGELDGVWYVAGLGLTALGALSLLTVLAAALRVGLWLRARRGAEVAPLASDTGRPLATGFALPRLRFWLFVEVRLSWLSPDTADAELIEAKAMGREQVRLTDHGEIRRVVRRIELRDVFGLASLSLRAEAPLHVDVLPQRGGLAHLSPLSSLAGGDDMPHPMGVPEGDRLELKRYAPGDPARFIHWKVYARSQKLVVRMPERALSRAYRVAAFLCAGQGDGASAAVARVALEQHAFGADFRFGADGSPAPSERVDTALVALRRSAAARAHGGADLSVFVEQVEKEGPAALVLFVPPHAPSVEANVAALVRQRARPVRVVIGVDGVMAEQQPSLLARVAFQTSVSARTTLGQLSASVATYKRLGCDVLVIDRESGRILGAAHLAHVAGSAARGRRASQAKGAAA